MARGLVGPARGHGRGKRGAGKAPLCILIRLAYGSGSRPGAGRDQFERFAGRLSWIRSTVCLVWRRSSAHSATVWQARVLLSREPVSAIVLQTTLLGSCFFD